MSTKNKQRALKKLDRARRYRSHRKAGAAALGAAAAIAAGTQAYAAPVRFENPPGPGHFEWASGQVGVPIGLDPTLPAIAQTGAYGYAPQFHQVANDLPPNPASTFIGAPDTAMGLEVGGASNSFLLGANSGQLIPRGVAWLDYGNIYDASVGAPLLPAGLPTYLGIRFPLVDGLHYGWIGVVRENTWELDTFAWGYETTPGVPIAAGVPEPGTLALLAIGAVGAVRRRRRSA